VTTDWQYCTFTRKQALKALNASNISNDGLGALADLLENLSIFHSNAAEHSNDSEAFKAFSGDIENLAERLRYLQDARRALGQAYE
jgi:hypothetical protein